MLRHRDMLLIDGHLDKCIYEQQFFVMQPPLAPATAEANASPLPRLGSQLCSCMAKAQNSELMLCSDYAWMRVDTHVYPFVVSNK